jgi:hypothetical protein
MGKRNLNELREQKAVAALNEKIQVALTHKQNLRTTFESENKDYLRKAVNLPMRQGVYPLEFAFFMLPESPGIGNENILTLLSWGADPNRPNASGTSPFEKLFMIDIRQERLPANFRFQYLDIVKGLIQAGADLSVVGQNGFGLVHYAASVSREAMQLLLEHRPADTNARDICDETPLFSAIRKGCISAALELILNKKVELNHRSQSGLTPLDATLYYPNPLIAQCLLSNGCSINVETNMINKTGLNSDDMILLKKLFMILMKAGYYIRMRSAQEKLLYMCYKEALNEAAEHSFVFVLEDEKTKELEFITDLTTLQNAKSNISESQNRRLHQSFREILTVYQEKALVGFDQIKSLYAVFDGKYPCPSDLKVVTLLAGDHAPKSLRPLNDLRCYLADLTDKAENDIYVLNVFSSVKNALKENKDIILTADEFLEETALFKKVWAEGVSKIFDKKLEKKPFHRVVDVIFYKFTMNVVLKFIKNIKTFSDLKATYDEILFFVMQCINLDGVKKVSSFNETVAMIDLLLNSLNKLQASEDMKAKLIVCRQVYVLLSYVNMQYYTDISHQIKTIYKSEKGLDLIFKSLVKKGVENHGSNILAALNKALTSVLNKIDRDKISITTHHKILNSMDELAVRFHLEGLRNKSREDKQLVFAHCKTLLQPRLNQLTSNLIHSVTIEYGRINIVFHEDASKAKIKSYFVDQGVIDLDGGGFYIPLDRKDISQVRQCLEYVNQYSLDEFKRAEQSKSLRESVFADKPWYNIELPDQTSSSPSTRSFASDVKGKTKLLTPAQENDNFEHKCAGIKQEIAQQYHVDMANVFLIHAPWLPQSRKHAAWGIWGKIEGERAETVSEQTLDRHKAIALQGKVCSKAVGESGLKVTGTTVTLKTKLVGSGEAGDLRVVSTPEHFQSASDAQPLTVYRFGRTSFHA